jgi:hypothetical protein
MALLELPRSRAVTPHAPKGSVIRCDELLELRLHSASTWETAEAPATRLDGVNGSSVGANRHSVRRPRRLGRRRPAPGLAAEDDEPRQRPAAGAGDPSRPEAAGRSPSGVRPPAGTERGNNRAPQLPAARPSRSSSGACRYRRPSYRPAGTGRRCSESSSVSSTAVRSTTATCRTSRSYCVRFSRRTTDREAA